MRAACVSSNQDRLGVSETQVINLMLDVVEELVKAERALLAQQPDLVPTPPPDAHLLPAPPAAASSGSGGGGASASGGAPSESEVLRLRRLLRGELEGAVRRGTLERTLRSLCEADTACDIRERAIGVLYGGASSGELSVAVSATLQADRAATPADPQEVVELVRKSASQDQGLVGALFNPRSLHPAAQAAQALLHAMSSRDQHIGRLTATIRRMEQRILEQGASAIELEAQIQAAKQDAALLSEELVRRQGLLAEASARQAALQEGCTKLVNKCEVDDLQRRHQAVDMTQRYLNAAGGAGGGVPSPTAAFQTSAATAMTLSDMAGCSPLFVHHGRPPVQLQPGLSGLSSLPPICRAGRLV